jgi:hypothetical protein
MRIWSALLVIVLSSLVQSTLVHAAAQVMRGRSANIAESMQAGLRRFFPVIEIWLAAFAAAFTLALGLVFIVALLVGVKGAQAVNLILSGVWSACFAAIMAVAHHDLRVAKEGVSAERILPVFD